MFWELTCRDSWWPIFNACPSGGNLPLCLAASLGTSNSWPLENQALSLGFYRFYHEDSQKEPQHTKVVWISAHSSEEGRFVASEFYLWKKKSPWLSTQTQGWQTPFQQALLCLLQVSQACSTNLWPARTGMYSLTVLGPRHLISTWQGSVSLRRSTPVFSILWWSHILHVWYSSIILGSASISKWPPWPPSPCLSLCPLLFVEEHQSLDFPPLTKSRKMILDIVAWWYLQRVFSSKVTFLVSPWDGTWMLRDAHQSIISSHTHLLCHVIVYQAHPMISILAMWLSFKNVMLHIIAQAEPCRTREHLPLLFLSSPIAIRWVPCWDLVHRQVICKDVHRSSKDQQKCQASRPEVREINQDWIVLVLWP